MVVFTDARLDPDIAAVAALIGDPSRALLLSLLADGRALPAGELARAARISPQTASAHLDKLFKGNLVAVEVQGRHHYYRLRDSRIAQLLESLSVIARGRPALTAAQSDRAQALRFARTCYGHLAGTLGVRVTGALCAREFLRDGDEGYQLGRSDAWLRAFGINPQTIKGRPLARQCLDWSERRHHLAGALGASLTRRLFELRWLARTSESRVVRVTDRGRDGFWTELGLDL